MHELAVEERCLFRIGRSPLTSRSACRPLHQWFLFRRNGGRGRARAVGSNDANRFH